MTRALVQLFRGEWSAAWSLHPLAPFLLVAGTAALAWWVGVRKLGWKPIERRLLDSTMVGTALLFLAVWVLRLGSDSLPPVSRLWNQ